MARSYKSQLWIGVVAWLLFLPVIAPGAPLPGLGRQDHRVPVDNKEFPWSAVGRVQTELGGKCTGFLISPAVVMTAAHCLWIARTRHYMQPSSVHFVLGYYRGHYTAHARAIKIFTPPEFRPQSATMRQDAYDRAVIVLGHPVIDKDKTLKPAPGLPAVTRMDVWLGGYDQDRKEVILADKACHFTGMTRDKGGNLMFTHDCQGTYGTSGAPILTRDDKNAWVVIGIQTQAFLAGEGGRGVFVQAPP